MKAIIHHSYGPPHEVLQLEDVDTPRIADHEVLVEVHASAVASRDCQIIRGEPYAARVVTGLLSPRRQVPGRDLAGRVLADSLEVEVGDLVQELQSLLRRALGGNLGQLVMHHGCKNQCRMCHLSASRFNNPSRKLIQMRALRNATHAPFRRARPNRVATR